MRLATLALVTFGLLAQTGAALGGQSAVPLAVTYEATPPSSMGAATDVAVQVTVTNAGEETWKSYAPPQTFPAAGQIALAYHWYDATGNVVAWDGVRTGLGADVATARSVTVSAAIRVPAAPGPYLLRFALVKENVEWLPPSQPYAVVVQPAYSAQLTAPQVTALVTGQTYTLPVSVQNVGSATWSAAGPDPVTLSYHWRDAAGSTVVWDGLRTLLAADVKPGAGATLQARVAAPSGNGVYALTFDLVRENVSWFALLGSTPVTVSVSVEPATYAAQYAVPVGSASYTGETRQIPVSITNTGNVPWGATAQVNLAYHIFDAKGNTVVWDGQRAALGDVAVGATKQVLLAYTSPTAIGDYTLAIDAVREGVAWFSTIGSPPVRLPMRVDSGFAVGYGGSTTPSLATIGARLSLRVDVNNYGPRALNAGGANPVALSYHLLQGGTVVTWDGLRGTLPTDIPPGGSASVEIEVQLPSRVGDYVIAWDIVQEGVAWLSQYGIAQKREPISVQPGVIFYGKGFGHGLGMSQWGAQGMATGAGGQPPKTGEQIVAYYYPGTSLTPIPPTGPNTVIRVLLSQPSSQGRYSCGAAYFAGDLANVVNAGGLRVLNEGQGNTEIFRASPNVTVQLQAVGGIVRVWNQATATPTKVYEGPGPVVTVPLDPTRATNFQEKGWYRGNLRFTNLGNTLRALNVLAYDDYVRGVVPLEMLKDWHLEAYKAQALAARTYAYNSYQGGKRDYDVADDQADQCYGGTLMRSGRVVETAITNRAVELTAGLLITYQGQAIRAYFSSSSGGYTKSLGCWANNVVTVGGSVTCAASPPYLTAVPDPADLAVSVPTTNRNTSWQVSFTSDAIRGAILSYRGIDIGTLLSVDLSNRQPAVVGNVVSVRVSGTLATIDLPADRFLHDYLFLRSTMVRLAPW